jgi:hypothetical protein
MADRAEHEHAEDRRQGVGPPLVPVAAMPVLPGASSAAHVTISGGTLSGTDVVRLEDPGKIEAGATVELRDGTHAEVVEVDAKRLSKFGILPGDVKVRLNNGAIVSKSSHEITRVLAAPQ